MPMSCDVAQQIADLINRQNQLAVEYTAARVLRDEERYIVRLQNEIVVGAAEVKLVQWYQCEIDHVSVGPKRQGHGVWLVEQAEVRGRTLGARVAQCTIRVGNTESEGLFRKMRYLPTVTFLNQDTGNAVTVYQRVLSTST